MFDSAYRCAFQSPSVFRWQKMPLLMEPTGVPGENHQPAAINWQMLSHNVASSTPRSELESNSNVSLSLTKDDFIDGTNGSAWRKNNDLP